MELRVVSTSEDPVTRVALTGRLDLQGTRAIERVFVEQTTDGRAAIVDLGEVSFLASMGMRLLLQVAKALHRSGRRLVILRPQENVRQALEVAGLVEILPVSDDDAEALALALEVRAAPATDA
ncbi:MAG: STAS domain-containing protein [Deltaproteobacteria bacterium]|nr:STAS domain-containing protein [Deltaproteobacteria bacterium]